MMNVHGLSLHFYDRKANSDKFYRAFVWTDGDAWFANYHWGRDGQQGMTKARPDRYYSAEGAHNAARRKVDSKVREGYQLLGECDFYVVEDPAHDGTKIGALVFDTVGNAPNKFDTIIREVGLIQDLV